MALAKKEAATSLAATNSECGWVTKPVIARHVSLSLRGVDNLMRQKAIPFAKFGRSVRFRVADVDRALQRFVRKEAK